MWHTCASRTPYILKNKTFSGEFKYVYALHISLARLDFITEESKFLLGELNNLKLKVSHTF